MWRVDEQRFKVISGCTGNSRPQATRDLVSENKRKKNTGVTLAAVYLMTAIELKLPHAKQVYYY